MSTSMPREPQTTAIMSVSTLGLLRAASWKLSLKMNRRVTRAETIERAISALYREMEEESDTKTA